MRNGTRIIWAGCSLLALSLSACTNASQPSSSTTTSVAPTPSPTQTSATTSTPSQTPTPTPTYTRNPQLSDQQNAFVQQIMEANQYSQDTAQAVLSLSQSLCNLLDPSDPRSASNQKFLTDMFHANEGSKLKQEWYNNALIATQTMCPDKTQVVKANRPEGVAEHS